MSSYKIAEILHIQQSSLHRWITIYGLNHKRGPASEETRKKISESKKRGFAEGKYKPTWLGKKLPENMKKNLSKSHIGMFKGEKSHFWKGGIYPENLRLRKSIEAKRWRIEVFKRDNYTCRDCGIRGGNLEAHHIKRWSDYPELRYNIINGVTLCWFCHNKTKNNKKGVD